MNEWVNKYSRELYINCLVSKMPTLMLKLYGKFWTLNWFCDYVLSVIFFVMLCVTNSMVGLCPCFYLSSLFVLLYLGPTQTAKGVNIERFRHVCMVGLSLWLLVIVACIETSLSDSANVSVHTIIQIIHTNARNALSNTRIDAVVFYCCIMLENQKL